MDGYIYESRYMHIGYLQQPIEGVEQLQHAFVVVLPG